jgi:hypothetical protein
MRKLLQLLISLLPVFFDRVEAAAPSLYGFQIATLEEPGRVRLGMLPNVMESKVTEFLRPEDRSGPPMAIAVVLDAAVNGSKRLNLDRGYSSAHGEDNGEMRPPTENQSALLRWPVVYLRSSIPTSTPGRILGEGRSTGRIRDGPTCFHDDRFEDTSTWPYSSWASLVAALAEKISPDSGNPSDQWSQADKETSFRAIAINHCMWLVLMMGADDHRWHRRRSSKIVDNDLLEFFDEMAALLRTSEWFKPSQALEIRRTLIESSPFSDLANGLKSQRSWDDDSTHDLLQSFRASFGLRALTAKEYPKASYGIRFGNGEAKKSPKPLRFREPVPNANYSHAVSACAFFLGSQLIDVIGTD